MNDLELKNLLLETCPVLPGQEERAWAALRARIVPAAPSRVRAGLFSLLRPVAYIACGFLLAMVVFGFRPGRHALVFADSQAPGVYATSFYSHSAQAQVVWLNGMEPATDRPTYLDPTGGAHRRAAQDPDSL